MSNFTDTYIKALKPKTARYEEYEGDGFGIRVTPKYSRYVVAWSLSNTLDTDFCIDALKSGLADAQRYQKSVTTCPSSF